MDPQTKQQLRRKIARRKQEKKLEEEAIVARVCFF
jgi:hypothetical protein